MREQLPQYTLSEMNHVLIWQALVNCMKLRVRFFLNVRMFSPIYREISSIHAKAMLEGKVAWDENYLLIAFRGKSCVVHGFVSNELGSLQKLKTTQEQLIEVNTTILSISFEALRKLNEEGYHIAYVIYAKKT